MFSRRYLLDSQCRASRRGKAIIPLWDKTLLMEEVLVGYDRFLFWHMGT